jgi:hypothetical protein
MTDMMAARNIHYYRISGIQGKEIYISKVFFSSSLKLDFHDIKRIQLRNTHLGKPVKRIHFIAIARAAGAVVLASSSST